MKDNQAKYPQLRFKGFTDPWVQRNLSDLATFSKGKGYSKSDLVSDGFPAILYGRMYTNYESQIDDISDTFVADATDAVLSQTGDIIVPGSGETPEDIARASNVNVSGIVLGGDINIIRPDTEKMDSTFLALTISNGQQQTELIKRAQGKSVVHLHNSDLKKVNVVAPSKDEQSAISSLFTQLDNLIAANQRKLDLLKEQKKGYLQKMFPKNGAKVPELRFAGFADAWEDRKLVSMTNYKNGKGHEDKQSTIGKFELINLNSISISGGLKHSGKFIDEADDTLQKDDLVMILSDVGHGDLLGRVALIPEDDRFVLNQRVALLRPNATADPQFLFSYINAHQYYFKAQGAGMSQLNISKGSVENFISFVPQLSEQKKIGTFFKQLDNTITLHQRKLDLLKEQKKGFLQKIFV